MSHASAWVALDCSKKKQIESALEEQMNPFNENDAQCFADGTRWDWYQIGGRFKGAFLGRDIIQRKAISRGALLAFNTERITAEWNRWHTADWPALEECLARDTAPCAHAFLCCLHWHENERMGWFGGTARNECQIARGADYKGKCLHVCPKTGARIVGWNIDPADWASRFWARFIEPLPPETWIVNVDYHV